MIDAKKVCEEFLERPVRKKVFVEYSGRLSRFNAHIINAPFKLIFKLSKEFLNTEEEITIGVMEHLLQKMYKKKKNTTNIDLYLNFIKRIADYSENPSADEADEVLKKSFDRVNKKYFGGFMEMPVLKWSGNSLRTLGTYTFTDDTIRISKVMSRNEELLDYVMYHEILHKKHKFEHKNGSIRSHTKRFRQDENAFGKDMEKKLEAFLREQMKRGRRTDKKRFTGFLAKVFGSE